MITKLTSTAALLVAALVALPSMVAASHDGRHGDVCSDQSGTEADFTCGEVTVVLAEDPEANIDEVIDRSAPEAEVIESVADVREREGLPPLDEAERTFRIAVPVDAEIDYRDRFAGDPDVESASLVYVGETTVPDTALAERGWPMTLIGIFMLALALLMTPRARATR